MCVISLDTQLADNEQSFLTLSIVSLNYEAGTEMMTYVAVIDF
jgi:hypothetical protein